MTKEVDVLKWEKRIYIKLLSEGMHTVDFIKSPYCAHLMETINKLDVRINRMEGRING